MNLDYISGFFDADGSITLCKFGTAEFRNIKIDFTNTKKSILLEIQKFLLDNYGIKSYISSKPARNERQAESFVLSTSYKYAYKLCTLLKSYHPMKKFRIKVILKYFNQITKRNGKYTEQQKQRKLAFERLFFCTIFQW